MSKPNKDGWIRHRGGKCPVADSEMVEVRFRNGSVSEARRADAWWWKHTKDAYDIMYYRMHKPEQVESAISVEPVETVRSAEQMRDRIREIDSTVEALEEERVSLVQQLEAEGFRLIDPVKAEPAEDMSDWRNWKAGDWVECIDCDGWGGTFQENCLYPLTLVREDGFSVRSDFVSVGVDKFRWHSRPSA